MELVTAKAKGQQALLFCYQLIPSCTLEAYVGIPFAANSDYLVARHNEATDKQSLFSSSYPISCMSLRSRTQYRRCASVLVVSHPTKYNMDLPNLVCPRTGCTATRTASKASAILTLHTKTTATLVIHHQCWMTD